MDKQKCKVCGKEIVGYKKSHSDFLMMQHMLKHRREKTTGEQEALKDEPSASQLMEEKLSVDALNEKEDK